MRESERKHRVFNSFLVVTIHLFLSVNLLASFRHFLKKIKSKVTTNKNPDICPIRSYRTNNNKKDVLFYHRGLERKSRRSRDTLSNRQVWPWREKMKQDKG